MIYVCSIKFQLEVVPSGPAFDLKVPLEIIIGTIPLRQDGQSWNQQSKSSLRFLKPLAPAGPPYIASSDLCQYSFS